MMITGKGEPTLFPDQVTTYLSTSLVYEEEFLHDVPNKELQSNGILLVEKYDKYRQYLRDWKRLGLDLIAISVVHYLPEHNKPIYMPYKKEYINLTQLIDILHNHGFKVRLALVMLRDTVDTVEVVEGFIDFGRTHGVEQLTMRPVARPDNSYDNVAEEWIKEHEIPRDRLIAIEQYLDTVGKVDKTLPYGGVVYTVNDQNICLTNCLTKSITPDYTRQIIFFPNGTIATDWTDEDATLP
jgi:hypothetical protein